MTDKAATEKDPKPPASRDADAAGEAVPKGTPTSDRHAAEVAHHDEESDTSAQA